MIGMKENPAVVSGLKALGIDQIVGLYHNLSFDELFSHETDPQLQGYERGHSFFFRRRSGGYRKIYRPFSQR